jgi:hypothetical protein
METPFWPQAALWSLDGYSDQQRPTTALTPAAAAAAGQRSTGRLHNRAFRINAAAPPPYRCAVRFLAWECRELDESSRLSASRKPVARRGATTNAGTGGSLRPMLLPASMETADTSMFWSPRHTPAWGTGPASTYSSSTPTRSESRQRVAEGPRSPEDTALSWNQREAAGAAGSRR